jgi:hypothetical protein
MNAMHRRITMPIIGALALAACDRIRPPAADLSLPDIASVQAAFARNGVDGRAAWSGNVVELRVTQSIEQLRRGGTLWARVGPYIFLFSPGTREILETWPGIAGVRVITATPEGEEIARALLRRDRMNETRWRRSLNLLGHALQEGTERPSRVHDLVNWGEQHTDYQYNPRFVPGRTSRHRATGEATPS